MFFVDSLMFGLVLYIWSIKIRNVNLENIKRMMPSNLNPKVGLWCSARDTKKAHLPAKSLCTIRT